MPACIEGILKALALDFQILLNWKWWLNGVITIIVAIFGLTGNFVSIMVMLQPKLKNSFNQLLIALCVFDSVFIVCNLLNSGPPLGIKHRKSANYPLLSSRTVRGGDPLKERSLYVRVCYCCGERRVYDVCALSLAATVCVLMGRSLLERL